MSELNGSTKVGVVGAGTMGSGIAQLAAGAGHDVVLYDTQSEILSDAMGKIEKIIDRQVEKGRMGKQEATDLIGRINPVVSMDGLQSTGLVIEAVVENLSVKQSVFHELERHVQPQTVLASNTSSLSIASVASACSKPERVIGAHFFNPAPLMRLVEVIPGIQSAAGLQDQLCRFFESWDKVAVVAKDTPGFIVNRVARPFYGESLRILEEGLADPATIDQALREVGGFKMGPFELMDLIGNDINFEVTSQVFEAFFYDSRFKPSLTQKRMVEAGLLGRKASRGYFDYRDGADKPAPVEDSALQKEIFERVLYMLINEAADAVFMQVASVKDVDLAMTKGVNYPKGLLSWADEIGAQVVLDGINKLYETYQEDRYRPNPLLKKVAKSGAKFHDLG